MQTVQVRRRPPSPCCGQAGVHCRNAIVTGVGGKQIIVDDPSGNRVRAILDQVNGTSASVIGIAHGTTVATNALLQGEIAGLGLIVTEGFRHILEIARQSVPEGYGNSYFWVKPDRIVPLRFVREVGGRLNFLGEELRPLDEDSVRAAARFFREQGITRHRHLPDALLCQRRARAPRRRDRRRGISRLHAVALLRRAAGIPRIRARGDDPGRCLRQAAHGALSRAASTTSSATARRTSRSWSCSRAAASPAPSRWCASRSPPRCPGPAAGALGSAVIAEIAGFPELVTLDAGGTSTDLCLIEGGKPACHQRRRGRRVSRCASR